MQIKVTITVSEDGELILTSNIPQAPTLAVLMEAIEGWKKTTKKIPNENLTKNT